MRPKTRQRLIVGLLMTSGVLALLMSGRPNTALIFWGLSFGMAVTATILVLSGLRSKQDEEGSNTGEVGQ